MAEINAEGLTSRIEIYDSEIAKINDVLLILDDKRQQRRSFENFDHEIKERFSEIGFIVAVNWYSAGEEMPDGSIREVEGVFIPEIVIKDRVEKKLFDHDQQRHEVVSNLLELPGHEKGQLLKATPEDFKKLFGSHGHHH